MKRKEISVLTISVLIMFTISYGNSQSIMDVLDPSYRNTNILNNEAKKIDGTPYLFDNFSKSKIVLKNGKMLDINELNIDILNNYFIVKVKENDFQRINPSVISGADIEISTDSTCKFFLSNNLIYQLLAEKKDRRLVVLHGKKILKGVAGNGYTQSTSDKIEYKREFYLFIDGKTLLIKKPSLLIDYLLDFEGSFNEGYEKNWRKLTQGSEEALKLIHIFNNYN